LGRTGSNAKLVSEKRYEKQNRNTGTEQGCEKEFVALYRIRSILNGDRTPDEKRQITLAGHRETMGGSRGIGPSQGLQEEPLPLPRSLKSVRTFSGGKGNWNVPRLTM
jgi:hypothetical protein